MENLNAIQLVLAVLTAVLGISSGFQQRHQEVESHHGHHHATKEHDFRQPSQRGKFKFMPNILNLEKKKKKKKKWGVG